MNLRLKFYKEFIDGIVKIRNGVLIKWVKQKGWPNIPKNNKINSFLSKLSPSEKEILAGIIQQARDGGIHDTLVFLSEQMEIEELKLIKKNIELAKEPYGTTLFYDWSSRVDGEEWPEHQLDKEYK